MLKAALRRAPPRIVCVYAASAITVSAATNAPSGPPTIIYQVPATCPSRTEFLREVLARSSPAAQNRALSIAERVSIAVTSDGDVTRGRLWSYSGEQREVVGTTCGEVVQALALVVALQARRAVEPAPPRDPSRPETTRQLPDSTPTTVPTSSATASTAQIPPALPAQERSPDAIQPRAFERSSLRLVAGSVSTRSLPSPHHARWTGGGGALAAFGPAPVGLFGVSLFVEYQPSSRLPYSVSFGAEAAPRATASIQGAKAIFQWWASRADGCFQMLELRDRPLLWVCAEIVGGMAVASGQLAGPITHTRTAYEGWFSVGPAARFRLGLPAHLSMELAASAGVPVIHYATRFSNPDLSIHETGSVAGFLLLQIGRESGGSDSPSSAIAK